MPSSTKSRKSFGSVSPVSPARNGTAQASDILNASIDSALVRELTGDVSPKSMLLASQSQEDASSIISKCQRVIEDLQYELVEERKRVVELETVNEALRGDLEEEREHAHQARLSYDKISKEKNAIVKDFENRIHELQDQVQSANKRADDKDSELENMTKYCEKRIEELKRAVKEASHLLSTPPLPAVEVRAADYEMIINELKNQLQSSSQALSQRDAQTAQAIQSYERQIRMLRDQVKSNEKIILALNAVPANRPPSHTGAPLVFPMSPSTGQRATSADSEHLRCDNKWANKSGRSLNPFSAIHN